MIFIPFGDSHTHFWGRQPNFPGPSLDSSVPHMFWLGPAKIYGMTKPTENNTKEKFISIKPILEQSGVTPIACIGEIDIRVNCAKEFLFTGKVDHLSKLADTYLTQLAAIKNKLILIWGPTPSTPDDGMFAPEYPAYGDNMTRNYLTHCFNKEIINKIGEFPNLRFISIFYNLVTENLSTKDGALGDGCHLSTAIQPQVLESARKLVTSENKIMINQKLFQEIKSYRRVFVPVTKWEKTPYINYYKKDGGNVVHYFSYKPVIEQNENVLRATLEDI